jgi:hypothetical protein
MTLVLRQLTEQPTVAEFASYGEFLSALETVSEPFLKPM